MRIFCQMFCPSVSTLPSLDLARENDIFGYVLNNPEKAS